MKNISLLIFSNIIRRYSKLNIENEFQRSLRFTWASLGTTWARAPISFGPVGAVPGPGRGQARRSWPNLD